METVTRTELVELYKVVIAGANKVKRNADKLAFMSMTKNNTFAFETYGEQLNTYDLEFHTARDKFAKVAAKLPVDEIVSIITEATQIETAAYLVGE